MLFINRLSTCDGVRCENRTIISTFKRSDCVDSTEIKENVLIQADVLDS